MDLKRCENKHFYDADKYATCPHCKNMHRELEATEEDESYKTQAADVNASNPKTEADNLEKKQEDSDSAGIYKQDAVVEKERPIHINPAPKPSDDGVTIGAFGETDPVVGWLVCVDGEDKGESFNLKAGMNFVGRSLDMDVALVRDLSVSKNKHVIIIYDPKNIDFLIHMGESKNLVYVNGEMLLEPKHLQMYDRILIGNTELMFIPFCSEHFTW